MDAYDQELDGLEELFMDDFDMDDSTNNNKARDQTICEPPDANDKQQINGTDDQSIVGGQPHDTKEYETKPYSSNAVDIEIGTRQQENATNNQNMGTDSMTDTATENGQSEHNNRNETTYTDLGDKQTENSNQSLRNENQCTTENIYQTVEKGSPKNGNEISQRDEEHTASEVLDKRVNGVLSENEKSIENFDSNQTLRQGTKPYSDKQTTSALTNLGPEKKQYIQKVSARTTARRRKTKIDAPTNISDQQSSSEDDQPLAQIARQSRKQQYQFDLADQEDLDDPAKDPDYKVKKKDLLVSESDSDSDTEKPRRKKKKKNKQNPPKKLIKMTRTSCVSQRIRDKSWKKKPSQLSKHKRETPGRLKNARKQTGSKTTKRKLFQKQTQRKPSKTENCGTKQSGVRNIEMNDWTKSSTNIDENDINADLERAKTESLNIHRVKQVLLKFHVRSVDTLLNSNGLRRKTIEGDGNCFFSAVKEATSNFESPQEVRKAVVNHLQINKEEYISFLTNVNKESHHNLQEIYDDQVEFLKEEGHWSTELCDLLPLAIANMMGREVIIYSSNRNHQLIEIHPTLTEVRSKEVLTLAYIALKGFEHYDICISDNEKSDDIQSTEKFDKARTPEKEMTRITPQATPDKTELNADATVSSKKRTVSSPIGITPRKRAKYVSPEKKKRSRKRKAHPENWKKNVRKQLRLSGKEYANAKGQMVPARSLKPHCCQKCRYKCGEKVSEAERANIFKTFWSLGNNDRQRDFICKSVMENEPQRIKLQAKTRRKRSRIFSLVVEQQRLRVCKSFFMKTLDLGEKAIEYAVTRSSAGAFTTKDKRGQHTPHNKTPEAKVEEIKRYIESFPVVDGHYTRKDSKRQYLGSDLNIRKMYNLYRQECKSNKKKASSEQTYRNIFCNDYNYSFHVPKKDQCNTCNMYNQSKDNSTELTEKYQKHIERKVRARQEKDNDKKYSKENRSYHTAAFDLEAVLPVPCSLVNQAYYKRKLSCYNLSVYSLGDARGKCYLWNETEGKRGSCEIATCLLMYIKSLPPSVTDVCLYSDTCTGQNRNRFVCMAMLHAVSSIPNVHTINQKFLESGHSQNECDSIHAAIEHAKKHTSVYYPHQWETIIQVARRNKPYTVVPLKHMDFLNFKPLTSQVLPASQTDTRGKRVEWMKVKWFNYRKLEPDCIYFKYNFDDEEFNCLKLRSTTRRGKNAGTNIPKCYNEKIPISEAKKSDLLSLCDTAVIPTEFHWYYKGLPCNKSVRDALAEPDSMEDMVDSEEE